MDTSALGIPFPPPEKFRRSIPKRACALARLPTAWVEGLGGIHPDLLIFGLPYGSISCWDGGTMLMSNSTTDINGDVSINGGFQSHGGTSKSSIYGWKFVPKTIHFGVPPFKETTWYMCVRRGHFTRYMIYLFAGVGIWANTCNKKETCPEMQTP